MNPSSMAWRMLYTWNGSGLPLGPIRPNSSMVLPLGVAVNAKNDRLGCCPRDSTTAFRPSSQLWASPFSAAACEREPRTAFISLALSPVWLECASSTITA